MRKSIIAAIAVLAVVAATATACGEKDVGDGGGGGGSRSKTSKSETTETTVETTTEATTTETEATTVETTTEATTPEYNDDDYQEAVDLFWEDLAGFWFPSGDDPFLAFESFEIIDGRESLYCGRFASEPIQVYYLENAVKLDENKFRLEFVYNEDDNFTTSEVDEYTTIELSYNDSTIDFTYESGDTVEYEFFGEDYNQAEEKWRILLDGEAQG